MENYDNERNVEYFNEFNPVQEELYELKRKLARVQIVNVISLVLIVISIGLSFISIGVNARTSEVKMETKGLPKTLTERVRNGIIEEFTIAYNANDSEKMYDLLGAYAQTVVTPEEMDETLEGLKLLGNIEKTSYSHNEFLGKKDGADWFMLYYIAQYENGDGNLTITLRVVDNHWEVVGFHMNVGQLQKTLNN